MTMREKMARNTEPGDVNHEPVLVPEVTWSPDGDGGWLVESADGMVSLHLHDRNMVSAVSPEGTVIIAIPGEPTINCGGVMRRMAFPIPRAHFDKWFVPA